MSPTAVPALWRAIRHFSGLSRWGQKLLLLAVLHWNSGAEDGSGGGDGLIPVLVCLLEISASLYNLHPHSSIWVDTVLPSFAGISVYTLYHESPELYVPSYRRLVEAMAGPPNPLFDGHNPAASQQLRRRVTQYGSLKDALQPDANWQHVKRCAAALLRLTATVNLIVRPLFRGLNRFKLSTDLPAAIRMTLLSTAVLTVAGWIGFVLGRWNVCPSNRWLEFCVRIAVSIPTGQAPRLAGPHREWTGVKYALLANVLYAWIRLIGREITWLVGWPEGQEAAGSDNANGMWLIGWVGWLYPILAFIRGHTSPVTTAITAPL